MREKGQKPRLLDLFCGGGGCSVGYANAGFEVEGVDINDQPNYPYKFHKGDALRFNLDSFDAIHASPPCQHFSAGARRAKTEEAHDDLIDPIRERLMATGVPFVIENIEPAWHKLNQPILLCGLMFNLYVFRHRLFEVSVKLPQLSHIKHRGHEIGDGFMQTVVGNTGGSSKRDKVKFGNLDDWKRAMKIDWMDQADLREAIPPAYTEWIGRFLIEAA